MPFYLQAGRGFCAGVRVSGRLSRFLFHGIARKPKIDLFNSLFGPVIGDNGTKSPSAIIRDFLYTPVRGRSVRTMQSGRACPVERAAAAVTPWF